MRHCACMVFMLLGVAEPALAEEQPVGGFCGARADCGDGLHCLQNVCVDEATFVAYQAKTNGEERQGFRPYLGGSVGGVLPYAWGGSVGAGVQPALHVGLMNDRYHLQLGVEVSPALLLVGSPSTFAFDTVATAGVLAPISDMVGWVVRAGVGAGFLQSCCGAPPAAPPLQLGFVEFRFDVVGVALRTSDHLQVELDAPSFRVLELTSYSNHTILSWVTTLSVDYLF